MARPDTRRIDGILPLDKPQGIGSNAVLQHVKRLFGAARAGHTGTLDPLASGLLVICLGDATKFSAELLHASKSYRARVTLGVRTTTADAEGEVLERCSELPDDAHMQAALGRFRGEILQVPPMHSALKRDGRPLYSYARRGETLEREPRPVTIHALELLSREGATLELAVSCSKGTYVRALAEDLGQALGCGAHLSGLVRTALGHFSLEQAATVDAIAALQPQERTRLLLPPDALLEGYPEVALVAEDELRFRHGQQVAGTLHSSGLVRVYGTGHRFLGTGWSDAGALAPRRVLPGEAHA